MAAVAVVVCLLLLHETATAIVWQWYSSTAYNHGFLIVPISLYLFWRVGQAGDLNAVPDWRGAVVASLACVVWLMGHVTGTLIVQEFSLIAVIQGVFLAMFGWETTRKFALPLLYLYFAVPFGDALQPRLQAITASLAINMLHGWCSRAGGRQSDQHPNWKL